MTYRKVKTKSVGGHITNKKNKQKEINSFNRSDKHFRWAEKELVTNDELYAKRKKDIIKELAERLECENEIETQQISTEISKRLSHCGISRAYVIEILPSKYKVQYRQENISKRDFSKDNLTKQAQDESNNDDYNNDNHQQLGETDNNESEPSNPSEWQDKIPKYDLDKLETYSLSYVCKIARILHKVNDRLGNTEAYVTLNRWESKGNLIRKENEKLKKAADEQKAEIEKLNQEIGRLKADNEELRSKLGEAGKTTARLEP